MPPTRIPDCVRHSDMAHTDAHRVCAGCRTRRRRDHGGRRTALGSRGLWPAGRGVLTSVTGSWRRLAMDAARRARDARTRSRAGSRRQHRSLRGRVIQTRVGERRSRHLVAVARLGAHPGRLHARIARLLPIRRRIDFHQSEDPTRIAFGLGMTYQVADTDSGRTLRRIVLAQTLLAYLFGAVILATSSTS